MIIELPLFCVTKKVLGFTVKRAALHTIKRGEAMRNQSIGFWCDPEAKIRYSFNVCDEILNKSEDQNVKSYLFLLVAKEDNSSLKHIYIHSELAKYMLGKKNKFLQENSASQSKYIHPSVSEIIDNADYNALTGCQESDAYILRLSVDTETACPVIAEGDFHTIIIDAQNYKSLLNAIRRNNLGGNVPVHTTKLPNSINSL